MFLSDFAKWNSQDDHNQDRNASVIDGLDLNFDKSISILDVGASIGVDALSNYEVLKKKMTVHHYTLGDLYTEIQYDKKRGLVFDQDGIFYRSGKNISLLISISNTNITFKN